MRATNVTGTTRLVRAVIEHGVPSLVYASSVGAYAPASKSPPQPESWPVTGIGTSTYSRHKAEVEALLNETEQQQANLRIVRMRTSLVFQRAAASEVHRLFLGRFLPWHLPRPLRLVPGIASLQFQATHAADIADAYVRALTRDVAGAFNVAAEPVLTPHGIAERGWWPCRSRPASCCSGVSPSQLCGAAPTGRTGLARHGDPDADHGLHSGPHAARVAAHDLLDRCTHRTTRRHRRRCRLLDARTTAAMSIDSAFV